MAKCPICGSEYYSSADRCYACSLKANSPVVEKRVESRQLARRVSLLVAGFVILALGWIAALLSADGEYPLIAYTCALAASGGALVAAYALFGERVPMWMVREGHRPENRKAVAMQSLGVFLASMAFLSAQVAWLRDDLDSGTLAAVVIVVEVSSMIIVVGTLRRPQFLFREDERVVVPFKERLRTGIAVIAVGLLVIVCVLALAPGLVVVAVWSVLLVVIGILTVFAGGFRPWLSTGYEK